MKKILLIGGIIATIVFVVVFFNRNHTIASVPFGNEYHSNVTMNTFLGTNRSTTQVFKTGAGTLGSVIITASGAGYFTLYDATTSNVNLRTKATSSLNILASFPTSATVGTYTFDNLFYDGLLLDVEGAISTSTITWR